MAAGNAAAADLDKAGGAELTAGNGGFGISFWNQFVDDSCLSSGSPGDLFTFTNYLLVDNTVGDRTLTVTFEIVVYEDVGGDASNALASETTTLVAAPGETATASQSGAAEYAGWNGDPSCGGNFLVYRSISVDLDGGSFFWNEVVY